MKLQVMIKHPYNNHGLDFRKPQCLSVPNTFIVLLSHFPFGCVGVLIHVFIQRSCRRLMVLFSWSKGSGRSIYLSIDRSINRSIYLYACISTGSYYQYNVCIYIYTYIQSNQQSIHMYYVYIYIYICIRILYVYGSPHLCLFPYHLLRPQVWFEGARLVEKKGTAAAIFLGSWNPHFSCVSHENGWPSGG